MIYAKKLISVLDASPTVITTRPPQLSLPAFAPEKYTSILDHGIKTKADLALARQFLKDLFPEYESFFLEADKVGVIIDQTPRNNGTRGSTSISFEHVLNRETSGSAYGVTLHCYLDRDGALQGSSLLTFFHELIHAVPYPVIPDELKLALRKVDSDSALVDIYHSVLDNAYTDEGMAFSSAALLANRFQTMTDHSLYDYAAHQMIPRDTLIADNFARSGPDGVKQLITHDSAYIPYRFATLSYAISIHEGEDNFQTWGEIFRDLGMTSDNNDKPEITQNVTQNFFQKYIASRITDIPLLLMGLSGEDRRILLHTLSYFNTIRTPEDFETATADFFANDFDRFVNLFARHVFHETTDKQAINLNQLESLGDRQTPQKPGNPDEIMQRPDITVDKIMINGKFVRLLDDLMRSSQSGMLENVDTFLRFAENADPKSAGIVYSVLYNALRESPNRGGMQKAAWAIGEALLRNGVIEQGRELLQLAVEGMVSKTAIGHIHSSDFDFIKAEVLIDYDLQPLIIRIIDYVLDHTKAALTEPGNVIDKIESYTPDDVDTYSNYPDWLSDFNHLSWANDSILGLCQKLVDNLTPQAYAKFEPELKLRIENLYRYVFDQRAQIDAKKIALYHQKVAPDTLRYDSLDELIAVHPQYNRYDRSDADILIGSIYSRESSIAIVNNLIKSPALYRMGLDLLFTLPDSLAKMDVFKTALANVPQDYDEVDRQQLIDAFVITRQNIEKGLHDWSFSERMWTRTSSSHTGMPGNGQLAYTHLFWASQVLIAQTYLKSSQLDIKQKGLIILDQLSDQADAYHNQFDAPVPEYNFFEEFRPVFFKAKAWLENIEAFPVSEQPQRLKAIFAILESTKGLENKDYRYMRQHLLTGLLQKTLIMGEQALFEAFWGEISKESFAFPESIRTKLVVLDLLGNEGSNRVDFLERVHQDRLNKRGQFPVSYLLDVLKLLSQPSIKAKVDDQFLISLTEHTIDLFVQSIGERDLGHGWGPIVDTINTLALSSQDKDNLLVYLIQKVKPHDTNLGFSQLDVSLVEDIWQAYRLLHFVIGNPDTPQAEALLLHDMTTLAEQFDFDIHDLRGVAVMKGLSFVYERLANTQNADLGQYQQLADLSTTDDYQIALNDVFRFHPDRPEAQVGLNNVAVELLAPHSDPGALSDEELMERYEHAIATRDVALLDTIKAGLIKKTNKELEPFTPKDKFDKQNVISRAALSATLFEKIYDDWLGCKGAGQDSLAATLFDILTTSPQPHTVIVKRAVYDEILQDSNTSLHEKRRIFHELCHGEILSDYLQSRWEKMIREHDVARETFLYQLCIPGVYAERRGFGDSRHVLYRELDPEYIAMALEYPEKEREQILALQADLKQGNRTIHNFDPNDQVQLEFLIYNFAKIDKDAVYYTRNFDKKIEFLFYFFLQEIDNSDKYSFDSDFVKDLPKFLGDIGITERFQSKYDSLTSHVIKYASSEDFSDFHDFRERLSDNYRFQSSFETQLKEETPLDRAIYQHLIEIFDRHKKTVDMMHMSSVTLPEQLREKGELIDFIIKRYFYLFPLGEQNELLASIDGMTTENALKIFIEQLHLEKIGQFLSFWPEVPEASRQELSGLQNKVAKSDLDEVKRTIVTDIADCTKADYLVEHIQVEPIAVGTIGDVYRSELPNGTPVVLKVITPSKEKNFRESLEKLKEVKTMLELYRGELQGATEAARFIDMYLQLVAQEFDLQHEISNREKFYELYGDTLSIPHYYVEFSGKKVAAIEEVNGTTLQEAAAGEHRSAIIEQLNTLREHFFKTQIEKGYYLSDLQPGNILVDPLTGRLTVIDFGQVGTLAAPEIALINQLMTGFAMYSITGSITGLVKTIEGMTTAGESYSPAAFTKTLKGLLKTEPLTMDNMPSLLTKILKVSQESGLLFEIPYLQLIKGLITLDSTLKSVPNG